MVMSAAVAQTAPPDVVKDLAPSGRLRAAINFGNPVLAQKDAATGDPRGVSVDLSRELARRLGVPVELVRYDAAGKVADAVRTGAWDIAFLAIDPVRANEIAFTAPYVLIEGTYLVRADSPLRTIDDVDRQGVRVVVGNKSAYDLHLTRTLKHAELVRAPTSQAVIEVFSNGRFEVAAGVKQQVQHFAASRPELRVMEGRFMTIEQAMATPKGREAGFTYLRAFVEEMKRTGLVAEALARSDQKDAAVAPVAKPQ
jgi:polar amino acid transport system substrate-binding protein